MIYGVIIAQFLLWVAVFVFWMISTRSLMWANQMLQWEKDRFVLIFEIIQDARVVTSIPDHSPFQPGPNGNIMYEGTMLNFQTLAEMTLMMVEQEKSRRLATAELRRELNLIGVWEYEHPKPTKPKFRSLFLDKRGHAEQETHLPSQTIDSERVAEPASHIAVRRTPGDILSKDPYLPQGKQGD